MMQTPAAGTEAAPVDIGEIVLHHTSDGYSIDFEPFGSIAWQKWPDLHIGGFTVNLTPTKHVVFMILAAVLVLVMMAITKRSLIKQRADRRAPTGFAGFIEQLVLWIRDDLAVGMIGENGLKYAPFLVGLFFFILVMNLMGLLPWGVTATGNLMVTASLAILVFLIVEIGGFFAMGAKGYLGTIFPHVPGTKGVGAVALTLFMAPIELMSKFTKPFALSVRLFGNMVAGHFVILSLIGIVLMFGSWLIGIPTAIVLAGIMLLETLVAALQAYVFVLLAATFIGLMQKPHH